MAAAGEDVKILGLWSSPFVVRARIALNLKGVEHENVEEKLNCKSDLLVNSNPVYKKVPVLLHNGNPVCESMIIVQYIDDVWASPSGAAPLLPVDPYDRAVHRFWVSYVDDKWHGLLFGITRTPPEEGAKTEAIEQVFAALKLLEEAFEKCSKGGRFFNGDDIGYLDISLGSYLGWLRVNEELNDLKLLDAERTPLLAGWAERFCAHDAVKGVMPGTDKLIHYLRTIVMPMWGAPPAGH